MFYNPLEPGRQSNGDSMSRVVHRTRYQKVGLVPQFYLTQKRIGQYPTPKSEEGLLTVHTSVSLMNV